MLRPQHGVHAVEQLHLLKLLHQVLHLQLNLHLICPVGIL